MQVWGIDQGLSEMDVLDAVRQNMVHEDGALRFALDTSEDGGITVKVMPKRGKAKDHRPRNPEVHVQGGPIKPLPGRSVKDKLDASLDELIVSDRRQAFATARLTREVASAASPQQRQQGSLPMKPAIWRSLGPNGDNAAGPPHPWRAAQSSSGLGLGKYKAARAQGPYWQQRAAAKEEDAPGIDEVMGMNWAWQPCRNGSRGKFNDGELVVIDDDDDADEPDGESSARAARVHHKMEQMGWTVGSQQMRLAAARAVNQAGEMQLAKKKQPTPRGSVALPSKGAAGFKADQVLKWIAWLLRKGHAQHGVEITSEGYATLEAVSAALDYADKGKLDAQSLSHLIRSHDRQPLFEIAGPCIRLVARGTPTDAAEDDALAGLCEQMSLGQQSQEVTDEPNLTADMERERPPPPKEANADGWTVFVDEDQKLWHYYDGPLGEWWCRELNGEVLPYGEEN